MGRRLGGLPSRDANAFLIACFEIDVPLLGAIPEKV
jgi:hypothetical protein